MVLHSSTSFNNTRVIICSQFNIEFIHDNIYIYGMIYMKLNKQLIYTVVTNFDDFMFANCITRSLYFCEPYFIYPDDHMITV